MKKILKSIKRNLNALDKSREIRRAKEFQKNKQDNKQRIKEERLKKDIFSWMKVPTANSDLNKLVRVKLIELITERGHYEKFERKIEEIEKNVPIKNSYAINDKDKLNDDFLNIKKHKVKPPPGCSFEQKVDRIPTNHRFIINNMHDKMKQSGKVYFPDDSGQQVFELPSGSDDGREKSSLLSEEEDGKWNDRKEKRFRNNRKEAMGRTNKDGPMSANYVDCALSSFIYGLINKESTHKTRNLLLNKYNDGNFLTVPELRYLTYTSESLNKFLDKEMYQKSVYLLDKQIIEDIEMMIAENIILGYYAIRNALIRDRKQYFDKINRKNRQIASQKNYFEKSRAPSSEIIKNRSKQKFIKHAVLRRLKNGVSVNNSHSIRGSQSERAKGFLNRNYPDTTNAKSTFFGQMPLKEYRHTIHPPSKILKKGDRESRSKKWETMRYDKIKDYSIEQLSSEYRLHQSRNFTCIKPERFIKFNSCGPLERNQYFRRTSEEKRRAVITIERFLLGRLHRMKHHMKQSNGIIQVILEKRSDDLKKNNAEKDDIENKPIASKIEPSGILKQATRTLTKKEDSRNQIADNSSIHRSTNTIRMNACRLILLTEAKIGYNPTIDSIPKQLYDYEGIKTGNLLQKQKSLLNWAKQNNIRRIQRAGFAVYPKDVLVTDSLGNTALYYSAKNGNAQICTFFLEKGADVNQICRYGDTALHMAFRSGSAETVMLLYDRGGNPNVKNKFGQTPLAFGSKRLLERLGIVDGVAIVSDNQQFDNNTLFTKIESHDPFETSMASNKKPIKISDLDESPGKFKNLTSRTRLATNAD